MDIGLVTWEGGPALAEDDAVLAVPLHARGLRAVPVVWSDPAVRWSDFALVVVRSTWDYFFRAKAFLAWLDRMEREGVPVWNPVPILRWNAHKGYLLELEARGVPIVSRAPTLGAKDGEIPDGVAAPEDEAERALADEVMAALPGPLLYARVDLATGLEGEPVLQEAELIEPRLFFRQGGTGAAEQMAEAIARRVAG